jgi:hypothetical protein
MRRNKGTEAGNYGIQAGGLVTGSPVQSGNTNSTVIQSTNVGAEAGALANFHQTLDKIEKQLNADRNLVIDFEQCIGFLSVAREQQFDDSEGRSTAKVMFKKLLDKCGGAPGVVSLVTSALTLLGAAQAGR